MDNPVMELDPLEISLRYEVEQIPGNAKAWRNLGMHYYNKGEREKMLACFEEVLKIKPEDSNLKSWLERLKK